LKISFHSKEEDRIEFINTCKEIDTIVVRTSQLAYQFYEKIGFQIQTIDKDFWAPGFDLYFMSMKN